MTRAAIERATKLSASIASAVLADLVLEVRVLREGAGRSVTYRLPTDADRDARRRRLAALRATRRSQQREPAHNRGGPSLKSQEQDE